MRHFIYLKDNIEEEKAFHLKGWRRIQKYYQIEDKTERYKQTRLKTPPHDFIKDQAKFYFDKYIVFTERLTCITETGDVLLGLGTELLLKAIILKKDPQRFINEVTLNKDLARTPPLWRCKEIIKGLLKNDLNAEQIERLDHVLTLINNRRNNLIHLSFHHTDHYLINYQILNVIEFLFAYHFPKDKDLINRLSKLKKKFKVEDPDSTDFVSVEFPGIGGD